MPIGTYITHSHFWQSTFKVNIELKSRCQPIAVTPPPAGLCILDGEVHEFECSLISGQGTSGLECLPQNAVERLNGVGGVDGLP